MKKQNYTTPDLKERPLVPGSILLTSFGTRDYTEDTTDASGSYTIR